MLLDVDGLNKAWNNGVCLHWEMSNGEFQNEEIPFAIRRYNDPNGTMISVFVIMMRRNLDINACHSKLVTTTRRTRTPTAIAFAIKSKIAMPPLGIFGRIQLGTNPKQTEFVSVSFAAN
jgi:hypothetical protein